MESKLDYHWLLIGGAPRSGTTMLSFLLNSHPNIYITNEHNFYKLDKLLRALYYKEENYKKRFDNFERIKGKKEKWENKDILKQTLLKNVSIKKVFSTLYVENANNIGKSNIKIFGDKLPRYYLSNFSNFEEDVSCLSKIHISRHPLDVINSMMVRAQNKLKNRDTWTLTSNLDDAINEWIKAWNYIVSAKSNDLLHVKYEDLCLFNIDPELRRISQFLEVENLFDKEILQSDLGDHFNRERITKDVEQIIHDQLGNIIYDWNEKPISELVNEYNNIQEVEIKTIGLKEKLIRKVKNVFKDKK